MARSTTKNNTKGNAQGKKKAANSAENRVIIVEDDRTGMTKETIKQAFLDHLRYSQGVDLKHSALWDRYMALSLTVRDRLVHRWISSRYASSRKNAKRVYYLSSEFLIGRQLLNALLNIGSFRETRAALVELGLDIYEVLEQEPEPGLGNGGLGRLAACFLDSLSTLDIPAIGYGIRYEFGIFEQRIQNGWQIEHPDKWLRYGNPWEIARPRRTVEVGFGGRTESYTDEQGVARQRWIPGERVLGTPYDTMVPGFTTNLVNTLRLWSAGTSEQFDFQIFDAGDYTRAVDNKTRSENISKVLYPNDNTPQGRELRLRQQFFFVSCSLQDILRRCVENGNPLQTLHEKAAIQMNDTHPAIAVPELMRLLVDIRRIPWDEAWTVTQKTLGYTNHTLLPEALERWPLSLFQWLLPRHLEIIYDINDRLLKLARKKYPNDAAKIERISLIEEATEKKVRMANLATVGSHSINGVAELHSELVKKELLKDFYDLWPERFNNKTNGVTPRRWLLLCNPKLSFLITEKIGRGWLRDLSELKKLEPYADDPLFRNTWDIFKFENKASLAQYIEEKVGVSVDPESLFDVQVKRLHEYKRQLLGALHIIALYAQIKSQPSVDIQPRTFIFGAKAAPGYYMAKLIIKLIHCVADVVNKDKDVNGRLKVVFIPNFCVSVGEKIYPAADLSEQISLAGKEASGTGNMKFAMNGALTVGTLDGANIEIRNAVGSDNFFLFGYSIEEVREIKKSGYNPLEWVQRDSCLKEVLELISSGVFSGGDCELFKPIIHSLLYRDEYLVLADYKSYIECQARISQLFREKDQWVRMAILNVARMGFFSSDRTIKEYASQIWGVEPIQVELDNGASVV